jgi:hypothetical protein
MTKARDRQRDVLDRLIAAAIDDARIQACWAEGTTAKACAPPFAEGIDLHLAASDPDFDALAADHAAFLARGGRLVAHDDSAGAFDARLCSAVLDGDVRLTLAIERLSLVPKRPRACVVIFHDRTHQVRYVMDFSKRKA